MVRVEDHNELAVGLFKRIVQVACLGVQVVVSREVANPQLFGERPDLWPATVVQNVRVVRVVEVARREQRAAEDAKVLVVRRHHHVDRAALQRRALLRLRGVPDLMEEQRHQEHAINLSEVEAQRGKRRVSGLKVQRVEPAVSQVHDRDHHRGDHGGLPCKLVHERSVGEVGKKRPARGARGG